MVLRRLSRLHFVMLLNISRSKTVQILKVFGIEFAIINWCCVYTNKLKC